LHLKQCDWTVELARLISNDLKVERHCVKSVGGAPSMVETDRRREGGRGVGG
jgi:hypothetical protein